MLNQVLTIMVGLCTRGIHRDRMRSTYYPGVCAEPGITVVVGLFTKLCCILVPLNLVYSTCVTVSHL